MPIKVSGWTSLVDYLIKTYGVDLFKRFFAQNDLNEKDSFEYYYKKDYEELLEEWKTYLKDYQVKKKG